MLDGTAIAGRTPGLVLLLCWSVFAVVWLGGAVHTARRAPRVRTRTNLLGVWVLGAAAYVLLRWLAPPVIWTALTVRSPWVAGIGLALLPAATAFTLWARARLGHMWTSSAVIRADHQLRTDGPYGIVRHPIYTGLLGMLAGSAMIAGLGRWVVVLALVGVLLLVKIRAEERLLTAEFGDDYLAYRRRVPMLLPGVRHGRSPDRSG